ncbi:YesL family protein [Gracilibacillus sp. YIM 98692]|uniref:YesL family protein n=1 Tax=Gracilibacillus sp. YIM 98692 TaxID=2663532 RepID=UPI0013D0B0A4|nr:YesL family protein [Gracilibacillus sp. YIM 98692]
MNRSFDRLNSMMDSFIFLAYINALWILFTLAGLIVFGFFPATTAMYAVFRKRVMGDESIKVFRLFWSTYRREFIKGNKLGYFGLSFLHRICRN